METSILHLILGKAYQSRTQRLRGVQHIEVDDVTAAVSANDNIFSLYLAVLDILEPQNVVNPDTAPLLTSPPSSMDPGNFGG